MVFASCFLNQEYFCLGSQYTYLYLRVYPPPSELITTHMNRMVNNQLNKFYCFSASLYGIANREPWVNLRLLRFCTDWSIKVIAACNKVTVLLNVISAFYLAFPDKYCVLELLKTFTLLLQQSLLSIAIGLYLSY